MGYVDADGVRRKHTFDYYVVLKSGVRLAIAVKPFKKKAAMQDVLERIQRAGMECIGTLGEIKTRHPDIKLRLLTEVEANIDAFLNAMNILRARSHYNESEYLALANEIKDCPGHFRFGQLFRNCTSRSSLWTAAWSLIDHEIIRPVNPGQINELSWMTVVR
nr:hypothetical protein [Ochrobactrum sp. UNC390CL2Tsu3S39]